MTGSERLVTFELLGQEFKFYTATSEQDMEAILTLVRREVEGDGRMRRGNMPAGKLAIMACLNIASQYVQLKKEFSDYKAENAMRAAQLSEEIRNSLLPE